MRLSHLERLMPVPVLGFQGLLQRKEAQVGWCGKMSTAGMRGAVADVHMRWQAKQHVGRWCRPAACSCGAA